MTSFRLAMIFLFIFGGALIACSESRLYSPAKDTYLIRLNLHNSVKSVESVCGVGYRGCYKDKGNYYIIESIKTRCSIEHELDHVLFGKFHEGKATCHVRY